MLARGTLGPPWDSNPNAALPASSYKFLEHPKRKRTEVWKYIRVVVPPIHKAMRSDSKPRLSNVSAKNRESATHVCMQPVEGGFCNVLLNIQPGKNGVLSTTRLNEHMKLAHPEGSVAKKLIGGEEERAYKRVAQMHSTGVERAEAGGGAGGGSGGRAPTAAEAEVKHSKQLSISDFTTLSKKKKCLTNTARL